jgi:2-amino-4-hydroxy-6-hydroxymethyldihydropteridine diphosphokinase
MAAIVETDLPAPALLALCLDIERGMGRQRLERWGPRTLDIDIITVAGERSDDPDLTLPHPRAHQRAFVLAPWHDADPGAVLPGHGPVADLLALVDQTGIRRSGVPLVLQEAGS